MSVLSAFPSSTMLTTRAGRPSVCCIRSARSSASFFSPHAPLKESCSPPPTSFQEPVMQGSMAMVREAVPPFSERCTP